MPNSKYPKQYKIPTTFNAVKIPMGNQEIIYLYELLYYLSDLQIKKEIGGFDIRNKQLQSFLRKEGIKLDYKTKPVVHYEKNYIKFSVGKTVCYSLLKHIRNAYAHGLLAKEKNEFVFMDKYQGKITAYGRIYHKLLFALIDIIVKSKK
ncbi:MAG: hypothetical protein IJC23_08200 [Bacteroidaceae bacterium]|nr:hypothetical protein [Bacteroidaceae bacterium]